MTEKKLIFNLELKQKVKKLAKDQTTGLCERGSPPATKSLMLESAFKHSGSTRMLFLGAAIRGHTEHLSGCLSQSH